MIYTHGHAAAVVKHHAMRTAERFADVTIKLLRPGNSILDVGCGPGSITRGFRKYVGTEGRVVGLDMEPKVLEEARKDDGAAKVEYVQGSVYELPFEDDSFDVVHAHQVLQHVRDPVGALKEMARVSRNVVVSREVDYESWLWFPDENGSNSVLTKWKAAYRQTCRENGADPDAGRKLKHWYRKSGMFNDDESAISMSSSTVQYSGLEQTTQFANTWASRVADTQLGEQMIKYGLANRQDVEDMARAWRQWGSSPDAYFVYVDVCAVGQKKKKKQ